MSIYTAIQEFTERYDDEAIKSIERLPAKIGYLSDISSMNAFNLKESCDAFASYIRGYGDYMKLNKDNPNKTNREGIKAGMTKFMEEANFLKECKIKYKAVPEFVKSYLEGIQKIVSTVDKVKEEMELEGVQLEYVGDVNEYADMFMEKLDVKFTNTMNDILWASGYNGAHKIQTPFKQSSSHAVTFL